MGAYVKAVLRFTLSSKQANANIDELTRVLERKSADATITVFRREPQTCRTERGAFCYNEASLGQRRIRRRGFFSVLEVNGWLACELIGGKSSADTQVIEVGATETSRGYKFTITADQQVDALGNSLLLPAPVEARIAS